MDRIEKFTFDHRARFWIQHDPDQAKEIAHAPAFHE
jgi:hypothetical protein